MNNKKILITGSAGFIGSHLVEKCVELGFDVKAFTHYNSTNSFGWLDNSAVRNDIEVVSGDVRDYDSVFNAMKGVDGVLHLAALIGIPYSYVSPLAYIRTNVEGTYNIVQAGRELDIENILVTSTSETYGTAQFVPITEQHPAVGQSPYSATKISADEIALSYYRSFNTPIKIARPFNTYGPRQSARAIIPTVISQIASGITDIKLGNLSPTRDLTFVKDTVKGFVEIFNSNQLWGEPTNIGMNDEISIGDLVHKIANLMDVQITINTDQKRVRPGKSEVERLFCDNNKIVTQTEWKPDYTLESGLLETIDWVKKNIAVFKPTIYNI
jgi:NAD dependent epimerase/dehydratase